MDNEKDPLGILKAKAPVTQDAPENKDPLGILKKKESTELSQKPSGSDSPAPAQQPEQPSSKSSIGAEEDQKIRAKAIQVDVFSRPAPKEKTIADVKIEREKSPDMAREERAVAAKQEQAVKDFATGQNSQQTDDPVAAFSNTILSGISDQLPKEYAAQRLRMSKGSFGDLFNPRSNISQFGAELPEGVTRRDFSLWNNKQPAEVRFKSFDEKAKLFLTEKFGEEGFEKLKSQFGKENLQTRKEFEAEIQQQNQEAAFKTKGVVQDLKEVKGASDFLNFAGNMIGQALYRAPMSLATGTAGNIIAESAAIYDRQLDLIAQDKGLTREQVIEQGLDEPAAGQSLAVLGGVLDAASNLNLLGFFKAAAKGALTKEGVKEFTKNFIKKGVPEGATEAIQSELEEKGASMGANTEYEYDPWRSLTSGIGGLLGGGVVGSITNVVDVNKTPSEVIKEATQQVDKNDVASLDQQAERIQAKVETQEPKINETQTEVTTDKFTPEGVEQPRQGAINITETTIQPESAQQPIRGIEESPIEQPKDIEVNQKSGKIIARENVIPPDLEKLPSTDPAVEETKKTLINAGKIKIDKEGKVEVKQNSGEPSQLFKDLQDLSGDDNFALNEYLKIKDDAGEFKKKFGDWENSIMKDYGRSGFEYKVVETKNPDADPNAFVWTKDTGDNNLQISFNEKKLKRDKDFVDVKKQFSKDVVNPTSGTPEQKKMYKDLYDKNVQKLRDIKLHLIHQAITKKKKGNNTIEDDIKSLQEIERLNSIELAKDYYGEPMIFMHGGNKGIDKFKKPGDKGYWANDIMTGGAGIYFSRSPEDVRMYSRFGDEGPTEGKELYYVFLRTKNPYYMTDPRARKDYPLESSETITKKDYENLKKLGYDSVIWDKEPRTPKKEIVVFDPSQIEIIGTYNEGLKSGKKEAEPKVEKPQKSDSKKYAIADRILKSDANEAIKKGVKEKGADYIPKKLDITDSEAKSLIDLYGEEKAETLIRDTKNDLTGDTRTALSARLYENYKNRADATTDLQEKQRLYDKAVDVALTSAEFLKESGRASNAAKIWKQITSNEDMTVLAIEKENKRQAKQIIAPIQKDVTMASAAFDEQIRKLIAQKVTEGVEQNLKRAKLITKEKKVEISNFFDSLKVKDVDGAANDITRVLGAAVWNGSLEAVKRAVLAGADVANAVQAGIDYIKDNYKGEFNEEDYRSTIQPGVEQMVPKEKISVDQIDESKIKTPKISGRKKKEFINEVVEAYNEGKLTDERFEELYAKKIGYKELTSEDRQRIRGLAKTIADVEKFEEEVKNDFTPENIAKYKQVLAKAQKANDDLQQYAQKPSNIWDTLISIMQGNLLTPLSLVTNVYSNSVLQPLRFLSASIGSVSEQAVATLAKTGLLNESYKDKTIDLKELQKGYFKGTWNGTIEGLKQLKTGTKGDERNLREINNQFSPVRAIARWAETDRTVDQKINDYVEGTFGWPAEVMFRLLNTGDKPFRRAAETARAMEIGKQKGLTGKELSKFLMFPDAQSAELINKAGQEATFQQESASAKMVQNILTKIIDAIGKTPFVGGPLKLIAKSQIPYVKTPWNIMVETLDYAIPPLTLARGIYNVKNGDKRNGYILIGKAITGFIIAAVAKELFSKGLLSWDDKDNKGKFRERQQVQYDNIPPNSLNVSAIQRGLAGDGFDIQDEDVWINYAKLGVMGILFDNYSNNYFSKIKEDGIMPEQQDYFVDMFTTAPRVLSQSLDQTFLKGTNSLLNAIQDGGGKKTEQWLIETTGALTSVVYPNTFATVSKSSDEFIRDTQSDAFVEKLKNTYKTKLFMGDQLPPKVNLWGEKVTGNPEGRDKYAFYLFDPTKFKQVDTENFKYKLYQSWKEDQFNDDWLPSIPQRSITYRGIKIPLNSVDYEKFVTYVGEERANLASTYLNSTGFSTQKKEKQLDRLKEAYEDGRERGKKKFLRQMGWNVLTPDKLSQIGKKN